MHATVRQYDSFGRVHLTPPTPRQLAATYAEKFLKTYDAQFGFAAIKHAANTVFMSPVISLDASGLIRVIVDEAVVDRFQRLSQKLRSLIPGVTVCESCADHTQDRGSRWETTTKRRSLDVLLPAAPLSDDALYGILDHTVTALDHKEVDRVVAFFGFDAESLLTACRERDSRVNTVISSLFDLLLVDEFGASAVREEYPDATQDMLVYAVQTRRNGGFYAMVAEIFTEYFEG